MPIAFVDYPCFYLFSDLAFVRKCLILLLRYFRTVLIMVVPFRLSLFGVFLFVRLRILFSFMIFPLGINAARCMHE